jgi:hypothetical protein
MIKFLNVYFTLELIFKKYSLFLKKNPMKIQKSLFNSFKKTLINKFKYSQLLQIFY